MELLDPSDSVSCPSTAPIGHSTSRGTPSSVGRPAIKPSTISRRLLGEVFQGRVLDLEIPGLPRFERVEDSYLAATGLDVYREVSKDPETANVGAVRFVKDDFCYGGEPGSMMRLAGPEGYWLMVLPRREERASPPKLHSSKVVMAPDEGKSVVAKDVAPREH